MATKLPLVLANGEIQQLQLGDAIATGTVANNTIMGNNSGSTAAPSALTPTQVNLMQNDYGIAYMAAKGKLNLFTVM